MSAPQGVEDLSHDNLVWMYSQMLRIRDICR